MNTYHVKFDAKLFDNQFSREISIDENANKEIVAQLLAQWLKDNWIVIYWNMRTMNGTRVELLCDIPEYKFICGKVYENNTNTT